MHYSHGGPLRIDRGTRHHRFSQQDTTLRRTGFALRSQYIPFILSHKLTTFRAEAVKLSFPSEIYIYSIHLYARLVVIAAFCFGPALF